MTDKLFDEFVKGKLEHYDSGAPMNVWQRIREKEKDDRKGFFFFRRFLLTGILLFTVAGIGYFVTRQVNKGETANINLESSAVSQQNKTGINNQQTKPGIQSIAPVSNQVSEPDQTSGKNQQTSVIHSEGDESKSALPVSQAVLKTTSIGINDDNNSVKNKVRKQQSFTRLSKQKAGIQISNREVNTDITDDQPATDQTLHPQYRQLDVTMAMKKFAAGNLKPASIPFPVNHPGCPTINGPRRNDLYIEVYGSPDYTMRTFSNTSLYNNYVSQRRSSEDNRNGFSAGIRIAKNIGEKFLVKGGVNYSQINERLRTINYNEKQLTQIITIRTVIRAPGDTLFIRDTSYFEQTGTRYITTYNRYRFIDIPVIFSYEFGNPEILSFSVNAGPVFNITSFYRGKVLDTAYSPVQISTSKGNGPNNWRSNIGVGVFASLSIYKPMGSRMQLFAEPYFRYNFRPVTQSSAFVVQRYSVSGMQLGIRYNLHNERQRYR